MPKFGKELTALSKYAKIKSMTAKIDKELKKLLEENALAFATVNEAGGPHCITIENVKVIFKNRIIIGDCYMVETIKNIQRNKNVALTIWGENWKEEHIGYELKGTAEYFISGKLFKKYKKFFEDIKGIILVTISKINKLA